MSSKQYSIIWQHYHQTTENDTSYAICNYCQQIFKSCGSTTTLRRHLEKKHPELDVSVAKQGHQSTPDLKLIPNTLHMTINSPHLRQKTLLIIGIGGGEMAGKTTLASTIINKLGHHRTLLLSHNMYISSPHNTPTIILPYPTYNTTLLLFHIQQLKAGESITIPSNSKDTILHPKKVLLVEGTHIYNTSIHFDLKLYIDTPQDIRLIRKIQNDIRCKKRKLRDILNEHKNDPNEWNTGKECCDFIFNGVKDYIIGRDMICSYVLSKVGKFDKKDMLNSLKTSLNNENRQIFNSKNIVSMDLNDNNTPHNALVKNEYGLKVDNSGSNIYSNEIDIVNNHLKDAIDTVNNHVNEVNIEFVNHEISNTSCCLIENGGIENHRDNTENECESFIHQVKEGICEDERIMSPTQASV